jgi:hypothetical protein
LSYWQEGIFIFSMQRNYTFTAQLWRFQGESSWHFLTLPLETAEDIRYYFSHVKRGWGSLRVAATIGATEWKTSIFSEKKSGSYILPVKALVRSAENIKAGDEVQVTLLLDDVSY